MLLIRCPYCGPRSELEFRYAGEAHIVRPADPAGQSDEAWATHLYTRSNLRGRHAERWRHIHGCGRFFNALRETATDNFLEIYPIGEPRRALGDAATPDGGAFKDDEPRGPAL